MASKKATASLVVVGKYRTQRVQVEATSRDTITQVTGRMENQLRVAPGSLSLLHQGLAVDGRTLVEDAFKEMNTATVVHLVAASPTHPNLPARAPRSTVTELCGEEAPVIYCKNPCRSITNGRPVICCSACKEVSGFERKSSEPLSLDQLDEPILGQCHSCKAENVQGKVVMECKAGYTESSHTGALLRDLHYNWKNALCMKCGNRRAKEHLVYVFRCSKRHVMCVECFRGFCEYQLNANNFKMYEKHGFSVPCPATNCDRTPVIDPHHFYVGGKELYDRFQDLAMKEFKSGHVCMDCSYSIDYGKARERPTVQQEENPVGRSSAWYDPILRLMRIGPPSQSAQLSSSPAIMARKRVKCPQGCDREYCSGCHALWHAGDCVLEDDPEFDIHVEWMKQSSWN